MPKRTNVKIRGSVGLAVIIGAGTWWCASIIIAKQRRLGLRAEETFLRIQDWICGLQRFQAITNHRSCKNQRNYKGKCKNSHPKQMMNNNGLKKATMLKFFFTVSSVFRFAGICACVPNTIHILMVFPIGILFLK
jgi:hypothetical protein